MIPLKRKLYNISILDQEEAAPESRCQTYGEVCMSDSECCSQNCDGGNCGAI